jgi:hypothetical protein
LYAQYDNAAFADLYHAEGKPALPPLDLLFVLALQALEDIGDRAAADAVRLRLDFCMPCICPSTMRGSTSLS